MCNYWQKKPRMQGFFKISRAENDNFFNFALPCSYLFRACLVMPASSLSERSCSDRPAIFRAETMRSEKLLTIGITPYGWRDSNFFRFCQLFYYILESGNQLKFTHTTSISTPKPFSIRFIFSLTSSTPAAWAAFSASIAGLQALCLVAVAHDLAWAISK